MKSARKFFFYFWLVGVPKGVKSELAMKVLKGMDLKNFDIFTENQVMHHAVMQVGPNVSTDPYRIFKGAPKLTPFRTDRLGTYFIK